MKIAKMIALVCIGIIIGWMARKILDDISFDCVEKTAYATLRLPAINP